MDVDWSLLNKAKNLVEEQIPEPILKIPLVQDHRELMVDFLRSRFRVLDVGANDRALKEFIEQRVDFSVDYKSMNVDRTHLHDFL